MPDDFEEFVRRVKEATHIEDVIDQEGADYRLQHKRGNYLRGEVHDSLVVRVDEQYYVWNDRSEKGDVFSWIQERRKWDFMQCLEWLAERAHIEMPKRFQAKEEMGARLAGRVRDDVFSLAAKVMAKWLWEDDEALAYVRSRGWSDETIREAGLGFSGRNTAAAAKEMDGEFAMHGIERDNPLAVAILGYKGDVKSWGRNHGIEVQENWREWGLVPGMMSKTRLVYAHYEGGRCKYLTGRNILGAEINKEGREVKSYNLPTALAGPRRLYLNQAYGRRAEECVLVEGQADAVTLGQWGFAAAATAGTSWEDQAEALKELRKRHQWLYLGMDNDDAGAKALMGKDNDWPLWELLGPMVRVVRWG